MKSKTPFDVVLGALKKIQKTINRNMDNEMRPFKKANPNVTNYEQGRCDQATVTFDEVTKIIMDMENKLK